jgi:uncharacterized membrane protein YedE/YeeE
VFAYAVVVCRVGAVCLFQLTPQSFGVGSSHAAHPDHHVTGTMPWVCAFVLAFTAGFAVGFGTRYSNGCTSGHGVCGIPRLNVRSFVAVGVWFVMAPIGACTSLVFSLPFVPPSLFVHSRVLDGCGLGWVFGQC